MFNSKYKAILSSLLCAASLALSACSTAEEPIDIQTSPTVTETSTTTTTTTSKVETSTDNTATEAATIAPETEATTPEETETSPKETEPPETTTSEIAPETTTPETTPALLWTETEASGILYINTDGVYSRAEAIQGSTKVAQYSLNDTVNVIARTDTEYFRLEDGSFIHSAYLSTSMTEITQATTAATVAATTAAPETEPPAETTNSTWGQYGQRENTQAELDFIAKTFDLVNAERAKNGLAAFQHLDVLDTISAIRAWELTVEYRSDHVRPDGTNGLGAFQENGIIYGAWSENVAAGQTTPQEVVDAWMNSPPHRAAILNTEYTHVGVGYYYSENDTQNYYHFWTLEFYRY